LDKAPSYKHEVKQKEALCTPFSFAAIGGKREEKKYIGETPNPGRASPAPFTSCLCLGKTSYLRKVHIPWR
jgi:hypothetical protein